MSNSDFENLIDLSNEKEQIATPAPELPAPHESQVLCPQNFTTAAKRDSMDNNPFDVISKQVNLCDDPFEIVALQAEHQKHTAAEVLTVNLLGLDEEAVEAKETDGLMDHLVVETAASRGSRFGSNALSSISSLNSCASPSVWNEDSVFSENVSPIPLGAPSGNSKCSSLFNNAFISNDMSGKLNSAREASCNADVFAKSATDSPRLQQTNSFGKGSSRRTSNSSGSRDSSWKHSGDFSALNAAHNSSSIRTHLLKLSLTNSPAGSSFRRRSETDDSDPSKEETGLLANQFLKLGNFDCNDSCDDIDALKPNWVDSETEQDSDLELLRIPMLQKTDKKTEQPPCTPNKKAIEQFERYKQGTANQLALQKETSDLPDLQELREKVERHKSEVDTSQDVNDLINSLKRIVFECSNGDQKTEANKLLENLSTLFSKASDTPETVEHSSPNTLALPQTIIRQGTFYLDKPNPEENKEESQQEIEADPEPEPESENCTTPPNLSPEVANIAEQIGKLLGNQGAVNVVQANLGVATANTAANPTYIVVMQTPAAPPSTPVRQNTQIMMTGNSTSPDLAAQKRRRSNSMSILDKSIKRPAAPVPNSGGIFNTPTRAKALQRRSTISNYSPAAIAANSKTRKSICETSTQRSPMPAERRTSLLASYRDVQPTKIIPKNISSIKADMNMKKLKLKCNETARRPSGPLRATIPIKKVAPMIITPSVSSPIDAQNKSKLLTSTPIPVISSLRAFPVDCSTPGIDSSMSPPQPSNTVKSKLRYSFLSTTPNPKSTSTIRPTSSVYNRRRSLSDPKSPKRPAATSRMSIGGANNTSNQSSVINTVRRLTSSKLGFGAPKGTGIGSITAKNKENTHPKTK